MSDLSADYGLTFADAARRAAERAPSRVVCRRGDYGLTLGQLDADATRLASALVGRGFRQADRAAILLPACPECLTAQVAISRAGGVIEFLIPDYGSTELIRMLSQAPPRWLFYSDEYRATVAEILSTYRPAAVAIEDSGEAELHWSGLLAESGAEPVEIPVSPDDDAIILFTSGTTGAPKGVRRSHASAMTHGVMYNRYCDMDGGSIAIAMQIGYENLACLLADGGCIVLADSVQPREWLATVERVRATHLGGVTSLMHLWLSYSGWAEFDLRSVRSVIVGAMSTPDETHRLVQQRLGLGLTQMYGSVEAGLLAVNMCREGPARQALGRPVEGKELRIVGEDGQDAPQGAIGELLVRPSGAAEFGFMRGYCDPAASPWRGGWLPTGDLVYAAPDGYLYLAGRTYETANIAGHKVFLPEVERLLAAHPALADVAIVAEPDRLRGEILVAHVVLRPEMEATAEQLRAWCSSHLAAHKVPKHIQFLPELPRTATGKVHKQALRTRGA